MNAIDILKLTAKSAPIPTIAALLTYVILPLLIETELSNFKLAVISITTFLIVFLILLFGIIKHRRGKKDQSIIDNEVTKVRAENGDAFIGSKDSSNSQIHRNKINNALSKKGDIFIGRK